MAPNYVLYGGVAVGVSVSVLVYMWMNDTKYFYNGKPGLTYFTWLKWKFMPAYKDRSVLPEDYDNLSKEDKAILDGARARAATKSGY
jgi:hypothetical protein